ncbi:MAG TPA: ribosome biogenesis GTPase YlqF [Tissierellaceae bacterium]
MHINWYPGHMKKTKESIQKNLHKVDLVIEILDARIPMSSQNPVIDEIIKDKKRIIILNKSDLSDSNINKQWASYFKERGIDVILMDSVKGSGISELLKISESVMKEKNDSLKERGVINRSTRAMILGIPNAGKSTLINTLSGRRGAKVGNRPGITKTNQWIKTNGNLELLDTPGILWPKFEDKQVGMNLAFTGAIRDEVVDRETLALRLIETLMETYPELLEERYNITLMETGIENMEEIGRKRGCIISGGEIDYTRVSNIVLDEFRKGIIGNITLEKPEGV